MTHYTGEEPSGQKGSVMTVSFELDGQEFVALNGGPRFKFTEAVSFVINCETQEEIDYYWGKLTAGGGEEVQCGWLADKYGLSWQVVPNKWDEWGKDAAGMQRLMGALMQMKKIDIATLEAGVRRGSDLPSLRLRRDRHAENRLAVYLNDLWPRSMLLEGMIDKYEAREPRLVQGRAAGATAVRFPR